MLVEFLDKEINRIRAIVKLSSKETDSRLYKNLVSAKSACTMIHGIYKNNKQLKGTEHIIIAYDALKGEISDIQE